MSVHRSLLGLTGTGALFCVFLLSCTGVLHAAESTSYILQHDFPNAETLQSGVSTSFQMYESDVTWYRVPAGSTNFQIVPPMNGGTQSSVSSSAATSQATSASTAGTTMPSGSRRPRVDIVGAFGALPSATSSSSSSQNNIHAAPLATETIFPKAPTDDNVPTALVQYQSETVVHPAATPSGSSARSETAIGTLLFFEWTGAGESTEKKEDASLFIPIVLTLIAVCLLILSFLKTSSGKKRVRKTNGKLGFASLLAVLALFTALFTSSAYAAQTAPQQHVYNGRLLTSGGVAITSAHSIRFSYWKSADAVSGDTTGTGSINTGATNYAGWQETHTVTPNAQGYFSVELGSVSALPAYENLPASTLLSLFLQVDVKASSDSDTAYEMLDIDSSDTAIDRSGILSVPFAANADTIDQREIGTASGSIAVLGPNGQFGKSVIPAGTNSGSFVLDADDTESSQIVLQFGTTLAKKLTYDITGGTFKFNTNLEVQGNLTVTGLINGIDLADIGASADALKASSGGGLSLTVTSGTYRLNGTLVQYAGGNLTLAAGTTSYISFGSGGLAASAVSFPADESFIPVAIVTTSAGSITSILDRRALSSDDREHTVVRTFNPSYEKASFYGDGTENVGQLSVMYDSGSLRNFYNWTSTRSTLQDYDILLKVPVTQDFVRWKAAGTTNPLTLAYRSLTGSALSNTLDIQVYDTSGSQVTLSGSVSGLANTSWTTTQIEFTGSPVWTAGQDMLIRIKPSAKDNNRMQIGELRLNSIELLGR